MKKLFFLMSAVLFTATNLLAQQYDFTELTGPYLGQTPPGNRPELFAPDIISVEENFEHSAAVFSPDGREVFWCTNVGGNTDTRVAGNLRLYTMKMVNGRWTAPHPASFVKDVMAERPVFSPDGDRLYIEFGSDPSQESDTDIYVVERTADGWSDPEPVSPLINSPAIERLHCVTADGSLYFSRNNFTPREAFYVSRWVNGAFAEPEKLGKSVNSDDYEAAILVAPDESYMLISHCDTGHGQVKFSISYKKTDGTWSERADLPFYNGGFFAFSPDMKYLFYMDEGIWWVSTSFIDELNPEDIM
ncbi:PD40 domain-containing protein [bacterium]|nr:PD40 domain-containing protein [bacterium]